VKLQDALDNFDIDDSELPDVIEDATMTSGEYPYRKKLGNDEYEERLHELQVELTKLQSHMLKTGMRLLLVFEGRDAAGKGGAIKRYTAYLNPRNTRVVALPKPSDRERGEWYFQRYVPHLPAAGETVLFDRSWYNRAGVEPVMGFCTSEQHHTFLREVPNFERMLTDDGILLMKFWLNIGRPMQIKRFHDRRHDPLKQWKLSPIDLKSLDKWEEYTEVRDEMLGITHTENAPWTVIRANDKRRSRISVIASVLDRVAYENKKAKLVSHIDPKIAMPAPTFLDRFGKYE